jgi:hypothetical protein
MHKRIGLLNNSELTRFGLFQEMCVILDGLLASSEPLANRELVVEFLKELISSFDPQEFDSFLPDSTMVLKALITDLWTAGTHPEHQRAILQVIGVMADKGREFEGRVKNRTLNSQIQEICQRVLEGNCGK